MTDRELLELAAKAAGYDYKPQNGVIVVGGIPANWNPLTDDADALRLAVDLWLEIELTGRTVLVEFETLQGTTQLVLRGNQPHAATRHAIVRAAAEIGRNAQ